MITGKCNAQEWTSAACLVSELPFPTLGYYTPIIKLFILWWHLYVQSSDF